MLKNYYYLIKPGIVRGNLITAAGGFFLAGGKSASGGLAIDWGLLLAVLAGLGLIIAAGCVFNNIYDQDIDSRMERTRKRAIVTGEIPKKSAFIYGCALLLLGVCLLYAYTNLLTLIVALTGFAVYTFIYTPLKKLTSLATILGSVSGAVPPVVGYVAVASQIDLAAILLFLILVSWQMPHFYSIGVFRLNEYRQAGVPVMPLTRGIHFTKISILAYIFAFALLASALFFYGITGYVYLAVMLAFSSIWLLVGIKGLKTLNDVVWAKKMFRFSLLILLTFSIMISIDGIIKL